MVRLYVPAAGGRIVCAVEILDSSGLVGGGIKRGQPFQRAELLIGKIGALRRPVVVGFKIQVFVLGRCEDRAQVDHLGGGADLGEDIVEHRVFVGHRRAGRQHLRVDDAGRRREQKRHMPGVARGERGHGIQVFLQLCLRFL